MGQRMDAAHALLSPTNINNVTGGATVGGGRGKLQDLILAGWRAAQFEAMIRLL